jgi:cold shock CspA family protein
MSEVKVIGRVIKVSEEGWGFISSRDIKFTRIFFHWTHLRQDTVQFPELKVGMFVEFVPLQLPGKGFRALHIRVVERPKSIEPALEIHDEPEAESPGIPEADVSPLHE